MTPKVFNSFSQSVDRLDEVLKEPKTVVIRDSAIKRFELTFELAWKSTKAYLANKGVVCLSPRDCLLASFRLGLIPDDLRWIKMIEDRNLSVHTYNEKLADDLYGRLGEYLGLFAKLRNSLENG